MASRFLGLDMPRHLTAAFSALDPSADAFFIARQRLDDTYSARLRRGRLHTLECVRGPSSPGMIATPRVRARRPSDSRGGMRIRQVPLVAHPRIRTARRGDGVPWFSRSHRRLGFAAERENYALTSSPLIAHQLHLFILISMSLKGGQFLRHSVDTSLFLRGEADSPNGCSTSSTSRRLHVVSVDPVE